MADNLDIILKALKSSDALEKNKDLINSFINSKEGKELVDKLNTMDKDSIVNMVNSFSKSQIDYVLSNPQMLNKLSKDKAAMEKLKKKLN